MHFSKVIITGLAASTAVSATPVATTELAKRDVVETLLTDVTDLLGTVVKDVTVILADAGLNVTQILDPILKPLDLKKREEQEQVALQARDVSAVLNDVGDLVSDILKDVGKITTDGLGLIGL
ncbi:hypothetical protein FT663_00287 [Candidozyma haemuli var. vulneris]|uniref:Uncharacterized protein n=1 Tax=Candidozyma haemuli TaxID=45357 RepID=A0A2V1ARX3_9ASCO|nr:hypothetical protein CXQ85_002061 [[Candida] haemuloni]KAF3993024.1 hypothetical protein FT662_00847 [[Candida] haemuloni var. vulneris]KAF3995540.1 hypothetical protein FT663_00287 [[Candida] haemuloni var. vulneris]PVH20276.1 hypothetical protein CXQ85_002061 [[Candida] haemuloni]